MFYNYNKKDALSILNHAKTFEEKRFMDIKKMHDNISTPNYDIYFSNFDSMSIREKEEAYCVNYKSKGKLGTFVEKYGFGYEPNNRQEADFSEAEVELKVTCIDIKKNGEYTAGERLSITNISFKEEVIENFYESHVWNKIKLILLIQYIRNKKENELLNKIKYVNLFTPPTKDLKIIIDDYNKIINKIKEGKAHELSEGDTMYLGACTKGSTAERSMQFQYYSNIKAKKRSFCLKRSYMDSILNEYVIKHQVPFKLPQENHYRNSAHILCAESVISSLEELDGRTFEELVLDKLKKYIGKTGEEICGEIGYSYNTNIKDFWNKLTLRMLGVKSNKAEEFVKANIVVKAIRVEENYTIKEHMSFPTFEFMEIVNQKWEDSWLFNHFSETKYLLTVYESKNGRYELSDVKFWNVPVHIIENQAKECWLETQRIVKEGVKFVIKGNVVYNNLPGSNFNNVVHVRPHTSNSAYKLSNGFEKGNIKVNASMLPNGEYMTKQCFWLDKNYLLKVLGYKK